LFVLRRHPRAKRRIPVFAFAVAFAVVLAFSEELEAKSCSSFPSPLAIKDFK
jgi:hypothetical protein